MTARPQVNPAKITLAVLAGGQSRRMGFPKTDLLIAGKPILQYLLDVIQWPGETVLVNAPSRQNPPGHEAFDRQAADAIQDQGPLRGILTALQSATTEFIAITTVDMPLIRFPHLQWLANQLHQHDDLLGAMCQHGNHPPKIEPFPMACKTSAAAFIEQRLAEGNSSVSKLTDSPRFQSREIPYDWPANLWTNLNSPEDFQNFLRLLPSL